MAICQPLCQPVSIVRRKRIESPHVDCRFLGWSVSGRTGRFLYPDHFVFEGWSEVYRHFISLPLLAQRLLSAGFFFWFFFLKVCTAGTTLGGGNEIYWHRVPPERKNATKSGVTLVAGNVVMLATC